MNQNNLSTEELLALLFKMPNLSYFLDGRSSDITLPSFPECISSLCAAQNEVPEHIIRSSGLEKSFGHQLFSGRRTPSRDTSLPSQVGCFLHKKVLQACDLFSITACKTDTLPDIEQDSVLLGLFQSALVKLVQAQTQTPACVA